MKWDLHEKLKNEIKKKLLNIIVSVRKVRQLFFPHLEALFTTQEATVKLINSAPPLSL